MVARRASAESYFNQTQFFFLEQILHLLASVLISVLPSPIPHSCHQKIRPKKALRRIKEKNYITVENAAVGVQSTIEKVLQMKPFTRKRRDVRQPRDTSELQGASPCQWKWELTNKRPNEIPSTLTRAICPSCLHYCKAISYTVRVLARDGCDTKSGLTIWRWKPREITIAYVYTGNS